MSQETKLVFGVIVVSLAIVIGGIFLVGNFSQNPTTPTEIDTSRLIREDSHKITANQTPQVELVEFGDLQCPACRAGHPTVKQILTDFEGQITYAFRHFPLPIHGNARVAAEAAEAAGEQGKFFEMVNRLFENQQDWAESGEAEKIFANYAQSLGLNVNQFNQTLESGKFADKVVRDKSDGNSLNVDSTPTFFINGEKISGVIQYSQFKNLIESKLR